MERQRNRERNGQRVVFYMEDSEIVEQRQPLITALAILRAFLKALKPSTRRLIIRDLKEYAERWKKQELINDYIGIVEQINEQYGDDSVETYPQR